MLLSLANAFIKRPVLTTVCSIVIVLLGTISMAMLPLDKLPEIAPKKVAVTANYIGADAKTTEDNVTTVLEREINGTEQVRWIDSFTDNTGNVSVNVTFPTEMNRNTAQVLVQNRVSQAQSTLPSVVNQAGIRTNTQSPSLTLVYGFYAENGPNGKPIYDKTFIYNYVDRYISNEMKGLPGVGSVGLFGGANYAMRIWLEPDKLAARGLTALDVVAIINEQNFEVGIGRIGQQPAPPEQQFEFPLRVAGRFTNVEEAENMVVKVGEDGTLIRIGDVGRAELGMENYDTLVDVDGQPGVAFLIYQLPGSNALETAQAAKDKMAQLEPSFPPGLKVIVGLDNTLFVEEQHGPLGIFFRWFNRCFEFIRGGYRRFVTFLTHIKIIVMAIFIGGLIATWWIYTTMPSGFIPAEDQGYFFALTEAPPGVSLNYTYAIDQQTTKIVQNMENADQVLDHVINLTGFSFEGRNANKSLTFIKLRPWEERPGPQKSAFGIIQNLNRSFAQQISGARVFAANAPPVDGLSSFEGSEIFIQDRQLKGMNALIDNTQRVIAAANKRPEIGRTFTTFTFNSPLITMSIDREKAKAQNVDIQDILRTLQTYIGSNFVNQFVFEGRLYRVYAQAEAEDRDNPEDIGRLYVRSRDGTMVQLSNLVTPERTTYPPILTRFKTYPAIKLIASPAPGYSSGQVIKVMEEVANEVLQPGFGYEWTNTAAEEKTSGGAAPIVFGLAFVMVFLVLAAQYESYVDPTIILLTVPLAILGALGAIWLRVAFVQTAPFNPGNGIWPILNNDMYAQVALVMLIGLAAKNAILIVEFANQARALGMTIAQAAISAAEERLRPILMTAVSSLVGFAPLLSASSVGAVSRWSLGTAIFGGLALATVLSLVLVPILYIVIKNFEKYILEGGKKPPKPPGKSRRKSKKTFVTPVEKEEEVTPIFKASSQND